MSSSTFTIGFTVHDAKSLVTKGGNPVDPLVVVRCGSNEFCTEIKRGKTGVVSWDQSHIWSDITLSSHAWASACIVFEVQSANAFWRNDVIGSCTLQLSMIHARRCHQVKRSVPLYLMNEPGIKGFLRITVYVIGPEDIPPSPNDQDSDDNVGNEDDIRHGVLDSISPNKIPITGKPYHLYISIYRVEHLPARSKAERDPFLTCEFAGSKLKTSQARSTRNHSFNECFRIPVVTPVQQDAIILKLWDWNFLTADELLAYGRLSFAELRSRPVTIRWFNFYAFVGNDPSKTNTFDPDNSLLGLPNSYMGRLQLSARVERLDRVENLMPAQLISATSSENLATLSIALLPDVYEITGVAGEEACVEIWCGPHIGRTRWQTRTTIERCGNSTTSSTTLLHKINVLQDSETAQCFSFDQATGRINTLLLKVSEDERQQWSVIISVYARGGCFPSETRVAYHSLPLSTLPVYVDVNPRTPLWIPLHMMPCISNKNHTPVAVLLTLEKTQSETTVRGKRKFISFQDYQLRCYLFSARNLPVLKGTLPNPAVRVCCSGVSVQSLPQHETCHPVFLECLMLSCRLSTDPSLNLSTMAPITVTVVDVRESSSKKKAKTTPAKKNNFFLACATCHYDRVQSQGTRNQMIERLNPRWIELKGGHQLKSRCGDILILLELVRQKDVLKTRVLPMRPELLRCSLTFSIGTLENIVMPKKEAKLFEWIFSQNKNFSTRQVKRPIALVSLPTWDWGISSSKNGILIPWNVSGEHENIKNKHWRVGVESCYDFFTSVTLDCHLPKDPIYDPKITISVYDKRIKSKYFIGSCSIDLLGILPWIKDVESAYTSVAAFQDFTSSVNLNTFNAAMHVLQGRTGQRRKDFINLGIDLFKEADQETIREDSQRTCDISNDAIIESESISATGLPTLLLKSYKAIIDYKYPVASIKLSMLHLNVFIPSRFVLAAHGVMAEKRKKDNFFKPSVEGMLENFLSDLILENHFLQKKIGKHVVNVGSLQAVVSITYENETKSLAPEELKPVLLDNQKFRNKFRGLKNLPSSIRLRVYVLRGIGLTPAQPLSTVNPFLLFKIGNKSENLRGNAKINTVNPEFCWFQECDISLPEQTRLEIAVYSKQQSVQSDDVFIGSTVIDLQTRWFSKEWQKLVAHSKVPLEYRPLRAANDASFSRSCGTLEMWIEMMTPQKASEIPRIVLKETTPIDVELRVVIWGARALSFKRLKKNYVDAQISATLDCAMFKGSEPPTQTTDVHYHSRNGNAIFNWRVVYSSISVPLNSCVLQLAAYDFRSISSSVFIGEVNIELRTYIEKVSAAGSGQEYDAEFKLVNRSYDTETDGCGFVQVTIQILSHHEALARSVGLGRKKPNREPHLTTPVDGRKWDDFIRAVSFGKDFSNFMFKVLFKIENNAFHFFYPFSCASPSHCLFSSHFSLLVSYILDFFFNKFIFFYDHYLSFHQCSFTSVFFH
ncbi:uncharacterized protein LOC128883542 isoform X2 [Hylaeus volcanicus]|uniref:uncharacterized protein LOC128883542 isoform X2 n=1 Tax=Hylaeus volcanicus TaxID=313075 RepID=UPI0023B77840|nr:uncharacterized protein LOC128883542 isoform X2 [Hylaeus volcanicus]